MGGATIGPEWMDYRSTRRPGGNGRAGIAGCATHRRQVAQVDGNQRLLALLQRRNRIIYYVLRIIT
jgi:hypothetical protein